MDIDVTALPDDELMALLNQVKNERDRRYTTAIIPGQIESLNRQYLDQIGRGQYQPWVQPTGAHDAYPLAWEVTHKGETWVSLIPANVWEPGVSGWGVSVPDGELPAWRQPTGAHDAYSIGALVAHNDKQWISRSDNNVWEPGVHGWDEFDQNAEFEAMNTASSFAGAFPEATLRSPLHPTPLGQAPLPRDEPHDNSGY